MAEKLSKAERLAEMIQERIKSTSGSLSVEMARETILNEIKKYNPVRFLSMVKKLKLLPEKETLPNLGTYTTYPESAKFTNPLGPEAYWEGFEPRELRVNVEKPLSTVARTLHHEMGHATENVLSGDVERFAKQLHNVNFGSEVSKIRKFLDYPEVDYIQLEVLPGSKRKWAEQVSELWADVMCLAKKSPATLKKLAPTVFKNFGHLATGLLTPGPVDVFQMIPEIYLRGDIESERML